MDTCTIHTVFCTVLPGEVQVDPRIIREKRRWRRRLEARNSEAHKHTRVVRQALRTLAAGAAGGGEGYRSGLRRAGAGVLTCELGRGARACGSSPTGASSSSRKPAAAVC